MGLIDFVRSAGEKIFGAGEEPQAPRESRTHEDSPEEVKALEERRAAAKLATMVQGLGFDVEELAIKVADGVATVAGTVGSQEDREKIVLAVGNVSGIAQVDDRLEVEADAPAASYYTVQSGDTLSKIAREYYGNAMKYPLIFEANKPMLSDPDKIYPGQVLRIPPLTD